MNRGVARRDRPPEPAVTVRQPIRALRWPPAGRAGPPVTLPVTFTPTRPGTFRAHYKLTWHDLKGTHTLDVVLTGKAT